MGNKRTEYRNFACSREDFRIMRRGRDEEMVEEGKNAFWAGVSPDHCPYLSFDRKGLHPEDDIIDWLLGWSKAYRGHSFEMNTPPWDPESNTIMGSGT